MKKEYSDEFLSRFTKVFRDFYKVLYNNDGNDISYDAALEKGDEYLNDENNKDFFVAFAKYRGDFISSDREIAALAYTMELFNRYF
jgi:hypothetical protein